MKKLSLNKVLIYLLLMIIAFGCASFPKKRLPLSNLTLETLNNLNGRYELISKCSRGTKDTTTFWQYVFNFSDADLGQYPTFYDEINFKSSKKHELKIDTLKRYSFTLKVINKKKLKIEYYENDSILNENTVKYTLKKDGYLYLKNINSEIVGIPYLFGEFTKKRRRITLDEVNNLIYETSELSSGGFFFVLEDDTKMKYEKIYLRID